MNYLQQLLLLYLLVLGVKGWILHTKQFNWPLSNWNAIKRYCLCLPYYVLPICRKQQCNCNKVLYYLHFFRQKNVYLTYDISGLYNVCPDASFQSVTEENPVQCKSVCYRRDFIYFQLAGVFCFCSNSNTCTGFARSQGSFPIVLELVASDGFISQPIQVIRQLEI